jgi:hypothetical protein
VTEVMAAASALTAVLRSVSLIETWPEPADAIVVWFSRDEPTVPLYLIIGGGNLLLANRGGSECFTQKISSLGTVAGAECRPRKRKVVQGKDS